MDQVDWVARALGAVAVGVAVLSFILTYRRHLDEKPKLSIQYYFQDYARDLPTGKYAVAFILSNLGRTPIKVRDARLERLTTGEGVSDSSTGVDLKSGAYILDSPHDVLLGGYDYFEWGIEVRPEAPRRMDIAFKLSVFAVGLRPTTVAFTLVSSSTTPPTFSTRDDPRGIA